MDGEQTGGALEGPRGDLDPELDSPERAAADAVDEARSQVSGRDTKVMELAVAGLTYRQIAAAMEKDGHPMSHMTAHRIVKRRLREVGEQLFSNTRDLRAKQYQQLDRALQGAFQMSSAACPVCANQSPKGTMPKSPLDPQGERESCPSCLGTGKRDERTRLAALDRVRSLLERQSKIAGLDVTNEAGALGANQAPITNITINVRDLSDDQLDREVQGLFGEAPPPPSHDVDSTATELEGDETPALEP